MPADAGGRAGMTGRAGTTALADIEAGGIGDAG
jgi:hypothetical protein